MNPQPLWNSAPGRVALSVALVGALLAASGIDGVSIFDWRIGKLHFGGLLFLVLPKVTLLGALAMSFYAMCGKPPEDTWRRLIAFVGLFGIGLIFGGWGCAGAVTHRSTLDYRLVSALSFSGVGLSLLMSWVAARPPLRLLAMHGLFLLSIPALGLLGAAIGTAIRR